MFKWLKGKGKTANVASRAASSGVAVIPVIAIDGPSGSGKGTIARRVAEKLGYHLLDSGALYRLVALAAEDACVALRNSEKLVQLFLSLELGAPFEQGRILERRGGKLVGHQRFAFGYLLRKFQRFPVASRCLGH
jgi:hypothetical protein